MAKLLSNTRIYGTATVDTLLFVNGANSSHSTATGSLRIIGGLGASGGAFFGGTVTATNFVGAISGTASLATDVAGGTAGQLLYQIGANDTGFVGPGTAGQILISGGTSIPVYVNTATFVIGIAKNLLGGSAGQFAYQTAAHTTNFISTGSMYVGRATIADTVLGGVVNTATNIAGGTAGQVPYQTAPGLTSFYGPGIAGQLLVSAGAGAPVYTNTASIYVGNAVTTTHLRSGAAGQVPYQTGVGTTAFTGPGTAGQVLTSGGTGAPVYVNTGSLYVGRAVVADSATSTGSSDQVKTVQRTTNAAHYLIFVDSNNVAATAESLYTTSSFVVNPSTGNVGIGITSPANRLHVTNGSLGAVLADSITHAEISGARHHLDFKEIRTAAGSDWNNTTYKLQMRVDSTNHQSIDFVSDGSFNEHIDIYTGNQIFNTRFSVNGRVGIGTNSPEEQVHIAGTTGDTRLRISADDGTNLRGFEVRAGTTFKGGMFYRTTEGNVMQLWGPNVSSAAIYVNANNNVGIGTANPGVLLDIDDNTAGGSGLRVTGGGSGAPLAQFIRDIGATGSSISINCSGNDPQIVFVRASATAWSVGVDDGNIFKLSNSSAIGTTDFIRIPTTGNIEIAASGNISFLDSGTTKRGIIGAVGGSDQWFFGGGATASNAGFAEIATGDDNGTEPIYVRQYQGGTPLTGSIRRTLTLLDSVGDSEFPASVKLTGALKLNGSYREYATTFSSTQSSGILIKLGEYNFSGDSNNATIVGEVMLGSGASQSIARFIVQLRSNILPSTTLDLIQDFTSSHSFNPTDIRLYHNGGKVVLVAVPGTGIQSGGWNIRLYERGEYNRWTQNYTFEIFDPTGFTLISSKVGIGMLNSNIGIGLLSPSYKLDVSGSGRITGQFLQGSGTARSTNGITIVQTNNNAFSANADIGDGNRFLSIVNESTTASAYSHLGFRVNPNGGSLNSMMDLKFQNTGATNTSKFHFSFLHSGSWADRLTITSEGNVGIGQINPDHRLQISNLVLGNTIDDRRDTLRLQTSSSNSDFLDFFKLRDAAGTDWQTAGWRIQQKIDSTWMAWMQFNGSGNNAGISFGAGSSTASPRSVGEHLRLTSGGNFGIGTTGPGFKLDITGTARASSDFRAPIFYDTNNTSYYVDPASTTYLNNLSTNNGFPVKPYIFNTYTLPNTGGATGWVRLGTFAGGQIGSHLYIKVTHSAGYNADNNQNGDTHIHFKTSNGSSNQGGFYGDGYAWRIGTNQPTVRVVQVTTSSYEVWMNFSTFTGNSVYYVSSDGTWTHSGTNNGATAPTGTFIDLSTIYSTTSGGSFTATADSRAPIFYDSNNTAFYTDPASTSNVNALTVNGQFINYAAGANASWNSITFISSTEWGDAASYGVFGGLSSGGVMVRRPHVVWNSSHASADIRLGRSGGVSSGQWVNFGIKASNVGFIAVENSNVLTFSGTSSRITAVNGVDAPIFYDSNNTAFYADPASTSRFNVLHWGNSATRTDTKNDAGAIASKSGFFETSGPTNYYSGASSWQHLIEARHSNDSNNYAMQIAGSFFDQNFYGRKTNNSSTTAWFKFLTSATTGDAVQFGSFGVGTAASGTTGEIRATNEITAYYSDRRLKENVSNINNSLKKLLQLNGITYTPNDLAVSFGYDKNKKLVGLFADEVEAVLPEAVRSAPFDTDKDGNSISGENYKTVQYEKLVPLLIEAIKEQQQQINELKSRLN